MIVTTLDTFTSLMAGITIFGILGNLAHNLKIDNIGDVVKSGAGLAFISYPDAIAKFDVVPQVKRDIFYDSLNAFYEFIRYIGLFGSVLLHAVRAGHRIGRCSAKCGGVRDLRSVYVAALLGGCCGDFGDWIRTWVGVCHTGM